MKRMTGNIEVALAAICWSSSGLLCKLLPWNAFTIHGFRALFAAIVLIALRGRARPVITKANLLGMAGLSFTLLFFMLANKLTTAANAVVLQYAMPIFVILFSWVLFRKRPSRIEGVAAICMLIGIVLCSWDGLSGRGNIAGDALALLSAVAFSFVFLSSRLPGADSREYTYMGILSCIPFALFAIWDECFSFEPTEWLMVFAMGVGLGLGYYFMGKGIQHTTPTTAALLSNLEPVLNPFWVFLFLDEEITLHSLLGMVIVLAVSCAFSLMTQNRHEKRME